MEEGSGETQGVFCVEVKINSTNEKLDNVKNLLEPRRGRILMI